MGGWVPLCDEIEPKGPIPPKHRVIVELSIEWAGKWMPLALVNKGIGEIIPIVELQNPIPDCIVHRMPDVRDLRVT